MDEVNPIETAVTSVLQKQLAEFAKVGIQDRKRLLPKLIVFIQENVTPEVIEQLINRDAQQQLQTAVEKTTATPIEINGQENHPWNESYTLVVLTDSGDILAALSKRPEDMTPYRSKDYNFYPPALIKALAALHLHKAGKTGGITDNWPDLKKLSFPYHAGSTDAPVPLGDQSVFVGASGCEATPKFVSMVLDGATPTHFTQAGAMDAAFAGITAYYLSTPTLASAKISPPKPISRLLAGN